MSWIKRNLYFLIGSLVALGLMAYGGFRLYSSISAQAASHEEVQKLYHDLEELSKQNPHPGSSGKVDNVQAAKEQDAALRAYIAKARGYFQRVTPIPDAVKVLDEEFASQSRGTVAQLNREAFAASATVPDKYYFTFLSELQSPKFDPGSLEKFALHLGEIKAICEILFDAKVNSLDAIQREVVSSQDQNAQDYLTQKTMSTTLADITPYRVVFRCFSAELASVLSGLANSPHGFIIKTINIEPAPVAVDDGTAAASPVPVPVYQQPGARQMEDRYRTRALRPSAPPPVATTTTAPSSGKPTPLINEHPLKVNLLIEVIRLKAVK